MKRMRIAGLCLVAVGAMFAFTSSAFAVEGSLEFGKCIKKVEAASKYKTAKCTKFAGGQLEEHKYEWEPLVGKTFPFTSAKSGTGGAVLQGASTGNSISCTGLKQTVGEYGPGKDEVKNVVGEFSGCEGLGGKCSNVTGKEGLVNTKKLHGEVGVVTKNATNEEKNIDGSDLRGQADEFLAEFTCASTIAVLVKGGVVVKAGSIVNGAFKSSTNKMNNKTTIEFKAAGSPAATQEPEKWTPQGTGVSHSTKTLITEFLESKFGGPSFEKSAQSLIVLQKSNPTTAKIELRQCKQNVC